MRPLWVHTKGLWKTHKHTSQEVVWQGQESEPVADMIIQLPRL